jgi:transcription-repair coupling factor (superfamily II helicase)
MEIKGLCRAAGVAQVDVGPKGVVVGFRDGAFANPEGLVRLIERSEGTVKVQPDARIVFRREWDDDTARLQGTHGVLSELVKLAERGAKSSHAAAGAVPASR